MIRIRSAMLAFVIAAAVPLTITPSTAQAAPSSCAAGVSNNVGGYTTGTAYCKAGDGLFRVVVKCYNLATGINQLGYGNLYRAGGGITSAYDCRSKGSDWRAGSATWAFQS